MSNSRLEVLLSSEATGQMFNICVWDPTTGTNLKIYKGSATKLKTFCVLGNTFIVSGQPHKPLLNVWQLNKHEQKPLKYITPGVLQSIASSPSGHILVGTNEERIYVWQTCSGKLLRILSNGHYQKINLLKFSTDGSHFISAGEDGNVIVWPLDSSKPRHIWNHHSLGVSDFHVGIGGLKSQIFTASKDQTSKVYDVASGQFLLDVEFNSPLSAISVDIAEENGFVGTDSGNIHMFSLLHPARDMKMSVEPANNNTFKGHTKNITCLSVSLDGLTLASGSIDNDVRIWHIKSRQCVKVIPHKGILTSLMYMIPKRGMLNPDDFKADVTLSLLEKTVVEKGTAFSDIYSLDIISNPDDLGNESKEPNARSLLQSGMSLSKHTIQNDHQPIEGQSDDLTEIQRLKGINQKLYEAAVKAILKQQ